MKFSDISLDRKGLAMIAIPLVLEFFLVALLANMARQVYADEARAVWEQQVTAASGSLARQCIDASIALTCYGMTSNKENQARFEDGRKQVIASLDRLHHLIYANATGKAVTQRQAKETLDTSTHMVTSLLEQLSTISKMISAGDASPLDHLNAANPSTFLAIVQDVRKFEVRIKEPHVQAEQAARDRRRQHRTMLMIGLAAGLIGSILAAAAVAVLFAREISGRLTTVSDNGRRLVEKQPLAPPQTGKDEVGQVDRSFHDMVHALELAAKREKNIIDNSQDVICSLSLSGTIVFINEASKRMWGMPGSQLLGQDLVTLVPPGGESLLRDHLSQLVRQPQTAPLDLRLQLPDRLVDTSWSIAWSAQNERYFCIVHDTTAKSERTRMKQRFMQVIGNQLRAPLEELNRGISKLPESAPTINEKGHKALGSAIDSMHRILNLVEDLIVLEQSGASFLKPSLAPVAVGALIEAALASLHSTAEFKKVKLEIALSEDRVIQADSKRLTQVLVNLMSNALKYTEQNTTITVTATADQGQMLFTILDQGPGIPESALPTLFRPFKRLDREIDRQKQGTGLGLAICRAIITEHGGTIGASNRAEGGACFYFSIPIC